MFKGGHHLQGGTTPPHKTNNTFQEQPTGDRAGGKQKQHTNKTDTLHKQTHDKTNNKPIRQITTRSDRKSCLRPWWRRDGEKTPTYTNVHYYYYY